MALTTSLILLVLLAAAVTTFASPGLGAQGAELLRGVLGDRATADIESGMFRIQDVTNRVAYRLGLEKQSNPWAQESGGVAAARPTVPPAGLGAQTKKQVPEKQVPGRVWPPPSVPPLGFTAGEGQWSPYLVDAPGDVLGYRTVLRPDSSRPYAFTVVVAIDLERTRMHFVLGSKEPASAVSVARSGRIPAGFLKSGLLLATFNGGFQARHGHFGAMANGVTVLPPLPGMGTVALYRSGRVKIGTWGKDVTPSNELVTWRQNGPLIINQGTVNPHTADTAPKDWGIVVGGGSATWRSGVGVSADGRTLYYVAGRSLTLPALARAMADVGVYSGLQLDINRSWVHFEALAPAQTAKTLPLFDGMPADRRYLGSYKRDFFYLTLAPA